MEKGEKKDLAEEARRVDELMAWISMLESEPEEKDVGRLKTPPIRRVS